MVFKAKGIDSRNNDFFFLKTFFFTPPRCGIINLHILFLKFRACNSKEDNLSYCNELRANIHQKRFSINLTTKVREEDSNKFHFHLFRSCKILTK